MSPQHKGWNSEQLPLPTRPTLLALSNGRALPSKWDDAEKWIFNPVPSQGPAASPFLSLHRPKSKSGPLRTQTTEVHVSGEIPTRRNFQGSSPFFTGVLMPDHGNYSSLRSQRSLHGEGKGINGGRLGAPLSSSAPQSAPRAVTAHVWPDLSSGSSSSSSTEHSLNDKQKTTRKPEIQLREMGTNISPECSETTSPKKMAQSPPSFFSAMHTQMSKLESRDLQVDDLVIKCGWPTSHDDDHVKDLSNVASVDWRTSSFMEQRASAWQASYSEKNASKLKRREAKIKAWENLKKAEAEARIRKLEMKLEKKRSIEVEKIMRDLRYAQDKAQSLRNSVENTNSEVMERETKINPSCFWKRINMTCFCGGFTCQSS